MAIQLQNSMLRLDITTKPERVYISGDWVLAHYSLLINEVKQLKNQLNATMVFDLSQLGNLDTAGAALLADLFGTERLKHLYTLAAQLSPERQVLLETVGHALGGYETIPKEKPPSIVIELLSKIGHAVVQLWQYSLELLGFIGLTLVALLKTIIHPARWRVTSVVANIEQIGLDAVPIIVLLTFMVGAVIAFLGATVLADFGATIYTVNLVVFSFLREFAVLLTAILMAGRTASAFTAQLGLMKANEEIDAIQTLGLSPIELLVLPRVLALLVSLPMLTFIGMISGILGGATICALILDISPTMFLNITQETEIRHFLVGMVKAPLFAFLIAVIGCLEGFKVSGSAESVGTHTTASVVRSIFVVILLDAVAALYFMEMGW